VSPPALRARDLCVQREGRVVLRDVTFDAVAGDVVGIVGPNGAGKTTLLRVLATLDPPSSGALEILGVSTWTSPETVRPRLGYLASEVSVYGALTVREHLELAAGMYRVEHADAVIDAVLELTGATALGDTIAARLSDGDRRRLAVARTLVHDPDVLVLDEPARALDPRARAELRALFDELRAMGKTIIVGSHLLDDIASLCSSVVVLDRGVVKARGAIDDVLTALEGARQGDGPPATRRTRLGTLASSEAAARLLARSRAVVHVEVHDASALVVEHVGGDDAIATLVAELAIAGVPITSVVPEATPLERVYAASTGIAS
jgi:ABC-2 type transport system ATP-binding protein